MRTQVFSPRLSRPAAARRLVARGPLSLIIRRTVTNARPDAAAGTRLRSRATFAWKGTQLKPNYRTGPTARLATSLSIAPIPTKTASRMMVRRDSRVLKTSNGPHLSDLQR
jgi:hypothetical protein